MKKIWVGIISAIIVIIIFLLVIRGQFKTTNIELAKYECSQECRAALDAGQNLENGPCLNNAVIEDWVCDVSHSPRIAVDNDPANQCSGYGKSAGHFVEVTPDCKFIRAV
ncbi:hypothetical protein HZA33_04030 [Candidatus Pacearchaeota archaeon]|nr:hypothetical protein [Candidatus Pacearchaeota archaeon]